MYTIRVNVSTQNRLIEVLNTLELLELIISIDYIPKLNSDNQSPLSTVVNKPEDERLYVEPLKRRGRPKKEEKGNKNEKDEKNDNKETTEIKKTKIKKTKAAPLIAVPNDVVKKEAE